KLGVKASLPELRKAAGTDAQGTTLAGLKRAAEGLRMKAEGVQAGREALSRLPTPALAWVRGDHYIAVLAVRGEGESGTAVIHDPNEPAERTIAQERLLQMSGGYLLTLRR
ncbi:MAG TPA: cysteine peptidase family C39 domain-containing protein, partial [Chthonomonadaceae bacterium]|nr:cysteine peptidase family C39 domain-containing protein [Chthonomonadaceae bacterium]